MKTARDMPVKITKAIVSNESHIASIPSIVIDSYGPEVIVRDHPFCTYASKGEGGFDP